MNKWVAIIIMVGFLAVGALQFYPPWMVEGNYVGHHSVYEVMFMEPDLKRLRIEQSLILAVTILLSLKFWTKRR